MSFSYIERRTGISGRQVKDVINVLRELNIIKVSSNREGSKANIIGLNLDVDTWKTRKFKRKGGEESHTSEELSTYNSDNIGEEDVLSCSPKKENKKQKILL